MNKWQAEPGWLQAFSIFHGLKILYYMVTIWSLFNTSQAIWTRIFPFKVSLFLLSLNLLVFLPLLYLLKGKTSLFGLTLIVLVYDFTLLPAEYYFHFMYLDGTDFFQSLFKIMPPYIFSLIFIMLLAWQFSLRAFVLLISVRAIMNTLLVTAVFNREFTNWLLWNIFEAVSLFIMGGIVYFLILQQRNQREEQKKLNLQLKRHATTVEELAVSWERNRLARELHDTLAHSLSALAVQLEVCRKFFDREPEKAKQFLEEAHKITIDGLNDTRKALKALRSAPLEDLGLVLALTAAGESVAEGIGASLHIEMPDSPVSGLLLQEEQVIYRIAQESLENIARHSGADHIFMKFNISQRGFVLEVSDNGSGYDQSGVAEGKWGLIGIAERAGLIGADLEIQSEIGHGTSLILTRKGQDNEYTYYR